MDEVTGELCGIMRVKNRGDEIPETMSQRELPKSFSHVEGSLGRARLPVIALRLTEVERPRSQEDFHRTCHVLIGLSPSDEIRVFVIGKRVWKRP